MLFWILLLSSAAALGAGCDSVEESHPISSRVEPMGEAAAPDHDARRKIVAFGDSLTAGYGIGLDEAYPAELQKILDREGYSYEVVNSGVSGETSAGGVRRLDWVLEGLEVEVLILALGANDGLRGLSPSEMKKNLAEIIDRAKERGIRVLLAGFEAPTGSQDPYLLEFVSVFSELAAEHEVALMPSLLGGVLGVPELNQEDGRHPNAEGARLMAENVFEHLKPLLAPPAPVESPVDDVP